MYMYKFEMICSLEIKKLWKFRKNLHLWNCYLMQILIGFCEVFDKGQPHLHRLEQESLIGRTHHFVTSFLWRHLWRKRGPLPSQLLHIFYDSQKHRFAIHNFGDSSSASTTKFGKEFLGFSKENVQENKIRGESWCHLQNISFDFGFQK